MTAVDRRGPNVERTNDMTIVERVWREWLVIESSMKNSVFAPDDARHPLGYIPRDAAEALLGRDLGAIVWFTREESTAMRAHPEWRCDL